MSDHHPPLRIDTPKVAHWSVILLVATILLVLGKAVFIPIVLAAFLAMIINAIRAGIMRAPLLGDYIKPTLATVIALSLLLMLLLLTLLIVAAQLQDLESYAPFYQQSLNTLLSEMTTLLGQDDTLSLGEIAQSLQLSHVISGLGESLSFAVSNLLFTLLLTAFFLVEQRNLPAKLAKLWRDPQSSERARIMLIHISASVQKYMTMKTLISALTGLLSYLVMSFFELHFAAMWAVLIFLLNFIPTIGSIIGVALPSLLSLLQFNSPSLMLMVALSLTVVQFTIGNVVEPAYFGKRLNLSPYVVLVALSLWGAIWGLVGMLLSIPLLVVSSIICQHIDGLQWISRLLSSDGEFMAREQDWKELP